MTRKISIKLGVALVLLIVALVGFIGQSFEENFETSGLVIDAYTQKTPFNGKGINQPSDPFSPNDKVVVYAKVTYNDCPCPGLFVIFSIFPPDRDSPFILSNQTNEEGIATCSFRVYSNSFGKWVINATTSIGEKPFAYDVLTFEVTWIVNITEIETLDENFHPKNIFLNEEPLNIKLILKNAAFSPQNVTISAVILDSAERCIINIVDTVKVSHGDNVIFLEKKIVPSWASSGEALLTVNIYNRPPELGGKLYCPSVSKTFKIGLVDLAIVQFEVSPLQVKRGEQLKLTVKVKNEGEFTQTFDLHIYINESLVRILPVEELEANSQKVIFLTLETSNMSEGSYLIKAYIPPLPGETDISDNEKTVSINVLQVKPSPPFAWNLFLLLLIIILLLAIFITLLILLKKRKRKEDESGHLTALVQLSV